MKNKFLCLLVILVILICGMVYIILHSETSIKREDIENNATCKGTKLKYLEGTNITSVYYDNFKNRIFVSDDGTVYKKSMFGIRKIKDITNIKKLSTQEDITYILFNTGEIKQYNNEVCSDIYEGKMFFWTDIASGKDFTAMLNENGEVWIKKSKEFYLVEFDSKICELSAYNKSLYALGTDGKIYYYTFEGIELYVVNPKQTTYIIEAKNFFNHVIAGERCSFFLDTYGNIYYWGRYESPLCPEKYTEILDEYNDENLHISQDSIMIMPQKAMLIFDNMKNIYRYPNSQLTAYFLSQEGELFLYSSINTNKDVNDNYSRLYKICGSVKNVMPLSDGEIIVQTDNEEYIQYMIDI